jgi:hypothetical protein
MCRCQHDATEARDEEIWPAVVVVVANGRAHSPARIADASFIGDVGKSSIVVVVVERAFCTGAGEGHIDVGGIGEEDVRPAVAVVVDESDAAAHGLDDVSLIGRREMNKVNSGGGGDVFQLKRCAGHCEQGNESAHD